MNDQQAAGETAAGILRQWLTSCTRSGKVSRNTVAVGIVVLNHLRSKCPLTREDVLSSGGEITGARSGLGAIFDFYDIPRNYLKEITTRQAHQDGQRLLESLKWGGMLLEMSQPDRDKELLELIGIFKEHINEWFKRQNMKLDLDRRQAPSEWVRVIIASAKGQSGGIVEQHLIGAKLERRFSPGIVIPNHPAHAADRQTDRAGDFAIKKLVYHVTAAPSSNVIQKCAANVRDGLHPILLVPADSEQAAKFLAKDQQLEKDITIISIEAFIALNVIELAIQENKDFYTVLLEIIEIYNKRLAQVETDRALQIDIPTHANKFTQEKTASKSARGAKRVGEPEQAYLLEDI
jgi:hypothetical protein